MVVAFQNFVLNGVGLVGKEFTEFVHEGLSRFDDFVVGIVFCCEDEEMRNGKGGDGWSGGKLGECL